MKSRVVSCLLVIVLVLSFVVSFFVWVSEAHLVPNATYYLLCSTDKSEQTASFDFERGGSGVWYQGKSVLSVYPNESSALSVRERLSLLGKETNVERIDCDVYCSKRRAGELLRKIKCIDGVVLVLSSTASFLESGKMTQSQANQTLFSVKRILNGCRGKESKQEGIIDESIQNACIKLEAEPIFANVLRSVSVELCLTLAEL